MTKEIIEDEIKNKEEEYQKHLKKLKNVDTAMALLLPDEVRQAFEFQAQIRELKAKLLGITEGKKLMIDEVLRLLDNLDTDDFFNSDDKFFEKDYDEDEMLELFIDYLRVRITKLNQLKEQDEK